MENKKQSSAEWLIEQFLLYPLPQTKDEFFHGDWSDIFEKAKAMHRSEIEDAYDRKVINEKQNWFIRNGKHYYDLHYGEQNSSVSIENNI